ncbi:response regulator transcription factor [Caenispirillum bisanense]|uniref:response regulator transcription factor n=1 Tax=Caenispirillum bisanense TaxID=414052 RepID=UPI0031D2B639
MTRFLIADDHPLYREALVHVLGRAFDDACCQEVASLADALAAVDAAEADPFDVILLDLFLPGAEGFSGLAAMRTRAPDVPVVIVSASERGEAVRQAMTLGAAGYLPKSSTAAITEQAIRLVLSGGCYLPRQAMLEDLAAPSSAAVVGCGGSAVDAAAASASLTRRQAMVLEKLAEGLSNKEIARALDITEITVKAHISAILRKFGVTTRAQAIVAANRALAVSER